MKCLNYSLETLVNGITCTRRMVLTNTTEPISIPYAGWDCPTIGCESVCGQYEHILVSVLPHWQRQKNILWKKKLSSLEEWETSNMNPISAECVRGWQEWEMVQVEIWWSIKNKGDSAPKSYTWYIYMTDCCKAKHWDETHTVLSAAT